MDILKQNGVFIDVISENLGAVTGSDGTKIEVNKTFVATYPDLYDSIYVVGRKVEHDAAIKQNVMHLVSKAYKYYKQSENATTGEPFIKISEQNNCAGVVFASNNPDFANEFVWAIDQQRFWNRV